MIEYRTLREADLPKIHDTFLRAFADYELPSRPNAEQFRHLLVRRGIHYDLSVGVFEGDTMVAAMATGFGHWRGHEAAYDIFTGVTPAYRGRGIAGAMIEFVRPRMIARGAQLFVLEVLQGNTPARRAYRRAGMREAREFQCFTLARDALHSGGSGHEKSKSSGIDDTLIDDAPVHIVDGRRRSWSDLERLWSWQPAWQNAPASIDRSTRRIVHLSATCGNRPVGYAIVEPETCDLCQLAVAPEHRRLGIGTRLLVAALGTLSKGPLRIINIDASQSGDIAFYRARGAADLIRQVEMILPLDPGVAGA